MPRPLRDLILDHCRRHNISVPSVAARMGMTRAGFYKTIKSKDIKVYRLRAISHILQHNFFEEYYPPTRYPSESMSPLATENKLLKEKLQHLETEVTYLREIFRLVRYNPNDPSSNPPSPPSPPTTTT
jgi:hypothetical protein